ncbi:MAG TPA: hypothetical protein VMR97_11705 [Acidimicrobiales bacterium]|nr:hypothetical protein [Acidimicrobiales bacterium]
MERRRSTCAAPEAESAGCSLCAGSFELGPESGVIFCELTSGHDSKWHRSDTAGFEWTDTELWPLPRGAHRAA